MITWCLFKISTLSHLDDAGSVPHAHKVLPLQDSSEAALQRNDPPQDLLVQEGLEALSLRLPQEHLCVYRYVKRTVARQLPGSEERSAGVRTIVLPT